MPTKYLVDGCISLPLGGGCCLGCFGRRRCSLAFLLIGNCFVTRHWSIRFGYGRDGATVIERGGGVELQGGVRVSTGDVAARESFQPLPLHTADSTIITSGIIVFCKTKNTSDSVQNGMGHSRG